jgi:hypothetical protein
MSIQLNATGIYPVAIEVQLGPKPPLGVQPTVKVTYRF